MRTSHCVGWGSLAILPLTLAAGQASAQCPLVDVTLRNPTASFTQDCGGYQPAFAIDASMATAWALGRCSGGGDISRSETLVFETLSDFGGPGPTRLVLEVFSGGAFSGTNLTAGRFQVSYTQAARDTFANGVASGGQLGSEWTLLHPQIVLAARADAAGNALAPNASLDPTGTILEDGTVLIGGPSPEFATYTVLLTVPSGIVRGLRLDFVDSNGASSATDQGLPTGGPGRHANGNMLLRNVSLRQARPISVLLQPQGGRVCVSHPLALSVTVDGQGPFTYQWTKNGVNIEGATTSFYMTNQAGRYRCLINSSCDSTASEEAIVTSCNADFNCDDFVDFFDYDSFVSLFQGGDLRADFNNDGFLDFFDYADFTAAFQRGC